MEIKKRCISLYVENRIGVLAKISGLLSGKSYNLDTLTVGETEDPTVSRMTIGMTMDDVTFEQVIKQLNRCVVVIKVIDFTEVPIHKKELLYIKVSVQCVKTEDANNDMIALFNKTFINRVEVVRGGSVAIEAVSTQER